MTNSNFAERILNTLQESAPIIDDMSQELRQQVKALIDSQIEKSGLVSREEFDALRVSLNRANDRLAKLEKEISNL